MRMRQRNATDNENIFISSLRSCENEERRGPRKTVCQTPKRASYVRTVALLCEVALEIKQHILHDTSRKLSVFSDRQYHHHKTAPPWTLLRFVKGRKHGGSSYRRPLRP